MLCDLSQLPSQKPEYQKENINLSWDIVQAYALRFIPQTPDFDRDNISYVDFGGKQGGNSIPSEGRIELDFRHSFGPKITVHELLHVVAGKNEFITGVQRKGKTRIYQGLNEGLTEVIGLDIFLKNFEAIKSFRTKYIDILGEKVDEAKNNGDNFSVLQYTGGCPHTGWYNDLIYGTLMHLNCVIIDYLTFLGLHRGKGDFEETRKKLWDDICFCYFNSDIRGFGKIIAPLQRRISPKLSEVGFKNADKTQQLVQSIKLLIAESFSPMYSLGHFSEQLHPSESIFHSTF